MKPCDVPGAVLSDLLARAVPSVLTAAARLRGERQRPHHTVPVRRAGPGFELNLHDPKTLLGTPRPGAFNLLRKKVHIPHDSVYAHIPSYE